MIAPTSPTQLRKRIAPLLILVLLLTIVFQTYPHNMSLWRSIALISAWAGSSLLVASILLMMREPHIAHLLGGLENMYLWHHRSGMLAYILLLCHPLALALNNWTGSAQLAWQTLAPWTQAWPIWSGWASLILLMFGLSSTFVLSLPYRRWRWMHMSLGVGVLLGMIHLFIIVGITQPVLVLLTATILGLSWRLVASDLGIKAAPYLVTQVEHLASGLIETRLIPRAINLSVSPGQFVLSAFGDGPRFHGCGEYHPFTVSGIEKNGCLRLTIKALGPCSQHLQELEPGVQVRLQGPFGTFLNQISYVPQLWIAGGIGITPFIAALRAGPCTQSTTLLYLFRNDNEAAFLDELNMLETTDHNFELLTSASDKEMPDFPLLLGKISNIGEREVFMCGPQPMVDSLLPYLRQNNIPENSIHFEKFDFR